VRHLKVRVLRMKGHVRVEIVCLPWARPSCPLSSKRISDISFKAVLRPIRKPELEANFRRKVIYWRLVFSRTTRRFPGFVSRVSDIVIIDRMFPA
jgi:hypothetical protein